MTDGTDASSQRVPVLSEKMALSVAMSSSHSSHLQEELQQIATWFSEEGLAPDSPKETQLCLLWRSLQCTRSGLSSVTLDLDTQRSQHLAEMAEVSYQLPNYHQHQKSWRRARISEGLWLLVAKTWFYVCLSVRYANPWSRSEYLQSTKMF